MASTRLASASASSNRPRASATPPSSLSVEATWGCTLPNTRSRITMGPLKQALGLVVALRLETESPAEHGEAGGGLIVIRSVERLRDVERLAVVALGFLVMPPLLLHRAEVDQIFGDERVTLTVQPAGHRQNEAVQRIGDRKVTRIVVRVRELAHAGGQLRSGGAAGRAAQANGLLEHLDSLVVPAALLQDLPKGQGGVGDGRVARPQLPLAHLKALSDQPLRFLVVRLVDPQATQCH